MQKKVLQVWDARQNKVFKSYVFLALATADGPGMACLNGCVGHSGKHGCRLYCPIMGTYVKLEVHVVILLVETRAIQCCRCNHDSVGLQALLSAFNSAECTERYNHNLDFVIHSSNKTRYEQRRLAIGIYASLLFLVDFHQGAFWEFWLFALDIMHLPALNIPDLFLPLWRGTFECDKTDSKPTIGHGISFPDITVWKAHGKMVTNATPYIPGSFDEPPRNP